MVHQNGITFMGKLGIVAGTVISLIFLFRILFLPFLCNAIASELDKRYVAKEELGSMKSDIAVIRNDVAWIKNSLEVK